MKNSSLLKIGYGCLLILAMCTALDRAEARTVTHKKGSKVAIVLGYYLTDEVYALKHSLQEFDNVYGRTVPSEVSYIKPMDVLYVKPMHVDDFIMTDPINMPREQYIYINPVNDPKPDNTNIQLIIKASLKLPAVNRCS